MPNPIPHAITVGELIEQLKIYNPEAYVCNYYGSSPICGVMMASIFDGYPYVTLDNNDEAIYPNLEKGNL